MKPSTDGLGSRLPLLTTSWFCTIHASSPCVLSFIVSPHHQPRPSLNATHPCTRFSYPTHPVAPGAGTFSESRSFRHHRSSTSSIRTTTLTPTSARSAVPFPSHGIRSHDLSDTSSEHFYPNDRNAEPCAPANRLRGHGTCGRPPPPFRPPAGAAPAPPVAELGVVRRSSRKLCLPEP
jgi:hypothetical protein